MHSYEFVSDNGFKVRNADGVETVIINPDGTPATALVDYVVEYAGTVTWSGSGASLATTIAGILATDIVLATIHTAPTQAAYIVSAAPTANTLTVVLSAANTSNDAVISYQVLRATV